MVKLKAVGDITLVTKSDITPFRNIKKFITNKDILVGNLETVLSLKGNKTEKAILLYNDPGKVDYLEDAGFDVLNLANNHINDLGQKGFDETLDVLNRNNISFFGVSNSNYPNRYAVLERKGIKFGFLGYCNEGFKNKVDSYVKNSTSLK